MPVKTTGRSLLGPGIAVLILAAISTGTRAQSDPFDLCLKKTLRDLPAFQTIPGDIQASFTWSMPDRYGLNRNNNAGIDLPNTSSYVANQQSDVASSCPAAANGDPQFSVTLDATGSKPVGYRSELVSSSAIERTAFKYCATPRDIEEVIDAYQEMAVGLPEPDLPDMRNAEFQIYINGDRGLDSPSGKRTVCLSEGRHRITVKVTTLDGNTAVLRRSIAVEDHFIAAMGDSFGAGEGSPEGNYLPRDGWKDSQGQSVTFTNRQFSTLSIWPQDIDPTAIWADGLIPAFWKRDQRLSLLDPQQSLDVVGEQVISVPDHQRLANGFDDLRKKFKDDPAYQPSGDEQHVRVHLESLKSHRSALVHASQAAMQLERADTMSSVTFVNLAQTGAQIDVGLVGPYRGYRYDELAVKEILFEQSTNEIEMFCETNQLPSGATFANGRGAKAGMCPQVVTLEQIAGGRRVDETVMSIGGNDVGFGYVIPLLYAAFRGDTETLRLREPETAACAGPLDGGQTPNWTWKANEVGGTVCDLLSAIKGGDWKKVTSDGFLDGFAEFWENMIESQALSKPTPTLGLNGLAGGYARVAREVDTLRIRGILDGDVILVGPPFFGTLPKEVVGKTESFTDDVPRLSVPDRDGFEYCQARMPGAALDSEMSPSEIHFADFEVFRPMVKRMSDASRRHGWDFIDQGEPERITIEGREVVLDVADHGFCGFNPYEAGTRYAPDEITEFNIKNTSAGIRWYRTPTDGKEIQYGTFSNNSGLFHPNEYGYAFVAKKLMDRFTSRRFLDLEGLANADRADSIGEARPFEVESIWRDTQVRLSTVDDVSMLKLVIPGGHKLKVYADAGSPTSKGACTSLSLFDEAGKMLDTNSRSLWRDVDRANSDDGVDQSRDPIPGAAEAGGCDSMWNMNRGLRDRLYPFPRMPVGGLAVKRQPDTPNSMYKDIAAVSLSNGGKTDKTVYLAVSDQNNVFFDPVTGRADTRFEIPFQGSVEGVRPAPPNPNEEKPFGSDLDKASRFTPFSPRVVTIHVGSYDIGGNVR